MTSFVRLPSWRIIIKIFIQALMFVFGGLIILTFVADHDLEVFVGLALILYAKVWFDSTGKEYDEELSS
jgi:hypothetical protein